ncbi:MAG: hypothetical protein IPH12_16625 [Saprospirales bacterium]|jgi:hypothetical protein|nr:hypothetical protein [Saprospirales bacterium]
MKKIALLVSATGLLIAIACQHKDANLFFKLDTPFSLDQGNLAVWEENDAVQLRFEKVTDSRCPVDAQCVWAGRVELELTFIQPGDTQTTTLILGDPAGTTFTDQAVFGDFLVKLLDVKPHPTVNQPNPFDHYTIQLEVKKAG